MRILRNGVWLLALALVAGCDKGAPPPAAAAPIPDTGEPRQAQAKLRSIKLWIGPEEMQAEIASTFDQVRTGMMFRTNMAENEGMLFVFSTPHRASFWMKNTVYPLSAAYIDASGTISEIHNLEPLNTNSVTAASDAIQYVLETRQGWFDRHNIRTGTVIRTEAGTLGETFVRR